MEKAFAAASIKYVRSGPDRETSGVWQMGRQVPRIPFPLGCGRPPKYVEELPDVAAAAAPQVGPGWLVPLRESGRHVNRKRVRAKLISLTVL